MTIQSSLLFFEIYFLNKKNKESVLWIQLHFFLLNLRKELSENNFILPTAHLTWRILSK